ncbi:hypothetical protein LTR94_024770 [Friedmanniomyces endolithicus]|nr:hypothetical protein LTR94_024770 [Friedmanniomyces endolithicus]
MSSLFHPSARRPRILSDGDLIQIVLGLDFANFPQSGRQAPLQATDQLRRRFGAYVSFHIDRAEERISVLRDPTGRICLWRLPLPEGDLLFSELDDVRAFMATRPRLNWDYLHYHLHIPWLWGSQTAFEDITEIEPGACLIYPPRAEPFSRQLWRPADFASDPFQSLEEAKRGLRAAAEQSAYQWANAYDKIALFLSGGLDSSIVLGLLRGYARHPDVVGVNLYIDDDKGDERRYAHEAAQLHGVQLKALKYSSDRPLKQDLVRHLLRPSLTQFPSGLGDMASAAFREIEADAYMTGAGGDHLFMAAPKLDAAADTLRLRGVLALLSASSGIGRAAGDTAWAALGSAIKGFGRRHPSIKNAIPADDPMVSASPSEASLRSNAPQAYVDAVENTPPAKLRQIMHICELQRHYTRHSIPHPAEEAHPLFSQPLIEAALRTPSFWFNNGRINRSLAREVFNDLLSQNTLRRRSKTTGQAHVVRVLQRDIAANRVLLLDGELVRRGLLDREKVDLALRAEGLAIQKNAASLINCITTEQWIQESGALD